MSDLLGGGSGNGRAANNGARATGGPVPVQPRAGAAGMKTPRDVWQQRQAREAQRRAEEDAAKQVEYQAQEEERRKSAERRAAAAAGVAQQQQGRSGAGISGGAGDAGYGTGSVPDPLRVPSGSRPQAIPSGTGANPVNPRTRASTTSQPRPVPPQQPAAQGPGAQRTPGVLPRLPTAAATQPVHTRTSSAPVRPSATATAGTETQSEPQPQARTSNVSSFPHAFERWENLSAHWEGLTSYWIRRLEANTEEVRREPLAQSMSRQITDLSAGGANLFHAVVELQRLRASSERKFQRWFFEMRQEQERMAETHANMERALAVERKHREEAEQRAERAERERNNDRKKTAETLRELQISKEEARRAWEELGRREQEERDRTLSLRDGHPTLVGGVQVVPMQGAVSRHGSSAHRPSTQERTTEQDQQMRQQFSYEEQSPTDTDPYASAAVRGATSALRDEPNPPTMGQAGYGTYQSGSTPATSSSTHTTIPADQAPASSRAQVLPTTQAQQFQAPPPTSEPSSPEAFYTHAGTYLSGSSSQQAQQLQQQQQSHPPTVSEPDDNQSYIPSVESEISEEEYEIDSHGNYVLDARGNPIPYRAPRHSIDSDNDSYDVAAELDREREHSQRYGTSSGSGDRYNAPSTMAGPIAGSSGAYAPPPRPGPDYEGSGYGDREYDQWAHMQRHHHPTRLSDVLEEDERSRTSPSRNSQVSRGMARGL